MLQRFGNTPSFKQLRVQNQFGLVSAGNKLNYFSMVVNRQQPNKYYKFTTTSNPLSSSSLRHFSTTTGFIKRDKHWLNPEQKKEEAAEEQKKKSAAKYTFTQDEIKGNTRGHKGLLLMAYTCGVCETKQARTFSKASYEEGVVLLRCEKCDNLHLIADNLGWFEDEKTNIEQLMKEKGESVHTNLTSDAFEIVDKTFDPKEVFQIDEPESPFDVANLGEEVTAESQQEEEEEEINAFDDQKISADAKHSILIQFCPEQTQQETLTEVVEEVDSIWPGLFNYYFLSEPAKKANTGHLDVTMFRGTQKLEGSLEGVLLYSKTHSGNEFKEEKPSFLGLIMAALK